MKLACPSCQRLLRCHKERRFDYGFKQGPIRYDHRLLYRYACSGRIGCQHTFLLIEDIPEVPQHSVRTQISEDWSLWNKAFKSKPTGVNTRKNTAGAFTLEAHCDTAQVWQKILKRFGTISAPRHSPA